MYLKHVITAGILSAALAIGPGAAYAQTGSTSGTSGSSQGTTSGSSSTQDTTSPSPGSQSTGSQDSASRPTTQGSQSSTQGSESNSQGSSGADQEAVRQHLTSAREALAELTKLPAASQLQGEQRQQVAQFISDFNAFATATTDWRPKYDAVDKSLDQLLGLDGSASAAASASGSGSATGASGSAGASAGSTADAGAPASAGASGTVGTSSDAAAGGLDPTIEAKLREVRTHLDKFEEASGDPSFVVEKIEKILDQASSGASGSGAVGTSGTATASDGAVTLSASQVQEIRRQLDSIKAAAKR